MIASNESLIHSPAGMYGRASPGRIIGRHKELREDLPGYRTCMTHNIELLLRKVADTQSQFICSTVSSPVLPFDINVHNFYCLGEMAEQQGEKAYSAWLFYTIIYGSQFNFPSPKQDKLLKSVGEALSLTQSTLGYRT